jgi:endoglucanase
MEHRATHAMSPFGHHPDELSPATPRLVLRHRRPLFVIRRFEGRQRAVNASTCDLYRPASRRYDGGRVTRGAFFLGTVIAAAITCASASAFADQLRWTGVNIAGAEFNGRKVPGVPNRDYFYPARATMDYVAAKGMNAIRVPFLWERMQPALDGPLDAAETQRLRDVVTYATAKGLYVILDVHNYAHYRRQPIGSAGVPVDALASLWGQLARAYKDDPRVGFGLMNEPQGLATETWLAAANAAIAAIRREKAGNVVFMPGNGWTGAHSWASSRYGTPNAQAMRGVVDPGRNLVFEVHQYLDSNFSGTHPDCRNETAGVTALEGVTAWLRANRQRGFLGEFGAGSDPVCLAALDAMLKHIADNRDVWTGWTYWAAGAWPPSYFTSIQPVNGADRPQMAVLSRHLARPRPPESVGAK